MSKIADPYTELAVLPCPFCGAAPVILPVDPQREGNAWGQVKCVDNGCPAQPAVSDGEPDADDRGSDAYKAAAVARWNLRMPADGR